AIELYQAILQQDPAQLPALQALDRIYAGLGRWKELGAVIEKEIAESHAEGAVAELRFRLGRVQEQHLKDPAAAVLSYRAALAASPGAPHEGARAALQAYLKDPERQMAAVEVLEPIYEQTGDLPQLVEVQRIKLGREKNVAKRTALLLRIGGLEQNLESPERAWEAYAQAFGED